MGHKLIRTFTLDLIFGIIIMELCTCLAAVVLPYKSKETFESSTVASTRWEGSQRCQSSEEISVISLVYLAYLYATIGALGVNPPPSAIFLISVYVGGLVVYSTSKLYRKKQRLDLNMVFKQIPPE